MKKAAVYARFSTDLQNERSIEDQVSLCRLFAAREGFTIEKVYEDRARSGASLIGRDGLLSLLEGARAGHFEAVIVEALDRLSRDMEDLAGLHKRLTFLDIEIRAVHEGQVNTVLVRLRGLIGQLYREDNAHKVRRGLAGRIAKLQETAGKVTAAGDHEATAAFRELVERVVVTRDNTRVRGVTVEITGRLNSLLGEKAWPNGARSSVVSMVAEEGLEPPTRGL